MEGVSSEFPCWSLVSVSSRSLLDTAEDPDDVNPRADVVASEITNSHQAGKACQRESTNSDSWRCFLQTKKGHISGEKRLSAYLQRVHEGKVDSPPRAAEYKVLIEIPAPTAASAPVAVAVSS